MVTRHQFLAMLHETLKPRGYLEIGVFEGDSLRLVSADIPAVGVDPQPRVRTKSHALHRVVAVPSDEFFGVARPPVPEFLDLAFVDGMHLFEYALRDFMNIEKHSNPRTVVAFDDVLPRNQHEAERSQCPGDWTGDVWKVSVVLTTYRPDLTTLLVDTAPTGTLLVWDLNRRSERLQHMYSHLLEQMDLDSWQAVPDGVLDRVGAVHPEEALRRLRESVCELP